METQNVSGGNGGKGGRGLIIVGALIIIALLAVIAVLLINRSGGSNDAASDTSDTANTGGSRETVVVTQENVENVLDEMANAEYVEPGYYTASMTNEWTFATGDAVSEDAYVENKVENTNDVYFDVVLEDNEEEVIYASPVLPRGAVLENIKLDKPLPAGTHNCVMIYHLVDEDQNTLSTLRVGMKIVVQG